MGLECGGCSTRADEGMSFQGTIAMMGSFFCSSFIYAGWVRMEAEERR